MVNRTARLCTAGINKRPIKAETKNPIPKYMIDSIMPPLPLNHAVCSWPLPLCKWQIGVSSFLSPSNLPTGDQHPREDEMAADTPQDMSLEQQKLVRTLVKALDAIAARLRRVPLDDKNKHVVS